MSDERPFAALPQPENEEGREPRSRGLDLPFATGIFFLLLIAAALGGLIAVYWPWSGAADNSATNDRLTALEMRVGQMENAHAPDKALAQLRARLDADEARIAAIQQTSGTPDLSVQLSAYSLKSDEAALEARIGRLEARDPTQTLKRAASVMALADLERVSASGAGFANELATLRAAAPDLPELDRLQIYNKGVPTRASLSTQLSRSADTIIKAEREGSAKNWMQKLWLHLADLVSVRRVGAVKGKATQDVLARAEVAANAGNLEQAVKELGTLDAPARTAAASWIEAAKARIELDNLLRGLSNRVVAMLAAPLPAAPVQPVATVPPP